MSDAIAGTASQVFQPSLRTPRTEQVAEQAETVQARRTEAAAETVSLQADQSSNRADYLSDQAERLAERAASRSPQEGLGRLVDITV